MTFCLLAKHLHIGLFELVYIYECIEISTIFKKSDFDSTLYTSKEIDWFGIKDNIKIRCYKLKFFTSGKNLFFSFFSKYHNWKILIHTIIWIII